MNRRFEAVRVHRSNVMKIWGFPANRFAQIDRPDSRCDAGPSNQKFRKGVGGRRGLARGNPSLRRTQEGCGGLGGGNPAAFPQARPIFQQPCSLPESAQTLARDSISCCPKIAESFSSSFGICRKTFPAGNLGQPQPSRVF